MSAPKTILPDLRTILSRNPFLAGLPENLLVRMAEVSQTRTLGRGEVLVREGDAAETLYFIVSGRFVVHAGTTPIAELAAGEPVGEIAFLAGGRRSATVTAMRASDVLEMSRTAYDTLSAELPELNAAIIRALAARVVSGNPRRAHLEPRPGATICVRPVSGARLPTGFAAQLQSVPALAATGPVITAQDGLTGDALRNRVHEAEARQGRVLLIVEDAAAEADWAEAASAIADSVLLVANAGDRPVPPDPAEAALLASTLPQHLHLALLRKTGETRISGTAAWLKGRSVGLHHHVGLDRSDEIARLGRFLTGTATGVVFCGGAAYGTAHLGMLKALQEHGQVFDMVGGSSMGAAMAGGYAMGLSPDQVMDMVDTLFLETGAMKRYTLPVWSVVDHTVIDKELQRLTFDLAIEDLPLPFYAVATSLTRNDVCLIRSGPLWRAIRASSAIPAVFPPMVLEDGEVLIDGGLMDNAPLGPMRDLKPGPNVVMNIVRQPDWRVQTPYGRLPGRGGALRQMLLPFGRKVRFPRIGSILSRTMIVNAERLMADIDPRDDVFLTMPPLPKMGFLDWKRGRALFDESYSRMSRALDTHGAGDLHAVARALGDADT